MLDVIAGLLRPVHGSVLINENINMYAFSPSQRSLLRRRHYAYLLQDCVLFEGLSVAENILLPVRIAGIELVER